MAGAIDVARPEDTGVIENLDRGKPLVYCSLGSDARFYPDAEQFFRAVAEASRLRPDWQWVLSVGPHSDPSPWAAGKNLAAVQWAPQMALLRMASVMVTHGGLNSMLECIHFEVPMVVAPAMRDQPGNMARAVALGIALGVRMKGLRAAPLAASIEQAMHSAGMRRRLAAVKQAIAGENGLAAVELVESLACAGGKGMAR
jgi:MGT family glycosyltransferase